MRACKHGLLELSTAGQGRINNMTTLQTRACPLVLPVFLSETWHRALPELLNKTCNMQLKPTLTIKMTPKYQMICQTITWARGKVVYRMASIKCYVLPTVTTKPSPGHITTKNGHLLLTVQTLTVGECYKLPVRAYFTGMKN